MVPAGEDHDIGVPVGLFVYKQQKDQADHHTADHCQGDHSRCENDAGRDGPEQERDVQRLFDGRAETDDGQRAHHAQRQDHVGGDGQDDLRGDHGEGDQRDAEGGGIHHALIRFFINKENEQAGAEGEGNGQHHVQRADGSHVFQKAGFENITECHTSFLLSYFMLSRKCGIVRIWKRRIHAVREGTRHPG